MTASPTIVARFNVVGGGWSKRPIEKQRVDCEFSMEYLESCCVFVSSDGVPSSLQDESRISSVKKKEGRQNLQSVCSAKKPSPSSSPTVRASNGPSTFRQKHVCGQSCRVRSQRMDGCKPRPTREKEMYCLGW